MVLFEIITKSNGLIHAQTKRTYTNFSSLDSLINAKYSKQILTDALTKKELPPATNMSNIASLSILREQLNLYLQELLRIKVIDVESGINQSELAGTKENGVELPKSDGHLRLILGPENDDESRFNESRTASAVLPEDKKLEEEI